MLLLPPQLYSAQFLVVLEGSIYTSVDWPTGRPSPGAPAIVRDSLTHGSLEERSGVLLARPGGAPTTGLVVASICGDLGALLVVVLGRRPLAEAAAFVLIFLMGLGTVQEKSRLLSQGAVHRLYLGL